MFSPLEKGRAWQEMEKSTAQVHLQSSSYGALGNSTLMLSNDFLFIIIHTLKPTVSINFCSAEKSN